MNTNIATCPYVSNFVRVRLIVDTIDLSEHADLNNGIKYVFTMIDSFSKFSWCYPSTRKSSAKFLKNLRHLHHREDTWRIFHLDNDESSLLIRYKNTLSKKRVHELYTGPHIIPSHGVKLNDSIELRIRA
ncbi:hypothetical protein CDIK_1498 [Cucumispora dikerogammari]|nr:hypothetical protein CDIK_1498 [Cucumispora dikerogammari]